MRLSRESVLKGAFAILDRYGLADLTMRRLAAELGIQPGGLYWHFANKQTLLAAMADQITGSDRFTEPDRFMGETGWRPELQMVSTRLRSALLAHRDGAELVAAGYALRPGSGQPLERMTKIIQQAGLGDHDAAAAAATLTHFVLGHAAEVQAHDQLRRAGALPDDHDQFPDPDAAFTTGLEIVLDGIAARCSAVNAAPSTPRSRAR
ncbi:TetR/AcrR family transcriptional regulator C-terminal domain-containing protein [Microlunatus endophyticus]|nr:TetR/AcrR family transcriptional regulator C-terminal domain-containing protein [Microlunatus endophyticus]